MNVLLAAAELPLTTISAIGGIILGWLLNEFSNRWSAKRLFDHRVRLEKEYSLYANLWDKLFEVRRTLTSIIEPVSMGFELPPSDDEVTGSINALQAVVRNGEPFMSTSVFAPAREIISIARKIITNLGKIRAADRREDGVPMVRNLDADEKRAEAQIQLEGENEAFNQRLNELCQDVLKAIRRRVSPR